MTERRDWLAMMGEFGDAAGTTVRWFAPHSMTIRSPATNQGNRIVTPTGKSCECGEPITAEDVGYRLPRLNPYAPHAEPRYFTYYHRACLMESLGIDD